MAILAATDHCTAGRVSIQGDRLAHLFHFSGITSSPSSVRQPEGNGCIEPFFIDELCALLVIPRSL